MKFSPAGGGRPKLALRADHHLREPPSIVLAARGENIVQRLPDLLLNYEGSRFVEPALYRDIVASCSRACREPAANIREMTKFVKRYEEHWINAA